MYRTICNIYFDVGFLSRLVNLVQAACDKNFSGGFCSFRQVSSPRKGQIAIMGSYDVEKIKNIAESLAGIPITGKYFFDKLGATLEVIE